VAGLLPSCGRYSAVLLEVIPLTEPQCFSLRVVSTLVYFINRNFLFFVVIRGAQPRLVDQLETVLRNAAPDDEKGKGTPLSVPIAMLL
jgi:hypothetical protein